jgi:peptidoglycan/xylan/chitin deacetylase (PgdA/CDA1 family)
MRTTATLLAALAAVALVAPAASAAVGDELYTNPGLEAGTGDAPTGWERSTWGGGPQTVPTFTWTSGDAHSGDRAVRVDVTGYVSPGDSKWVPAAPMRVTGGRYYVFSDWYRSTATTAVSVYWENAAGAGKWANLFSGIAPSPSGWTQYRTGFNMPASAVKAYFVHFLARDGMLATDDYSMKETADPPGFSAPMISLTFDDGSHAFYTEALPPLDARGFRTTQYIPTQGLETGDPWMMTGAQLRELAGQGHEIASHSVTHPLLTEVTDPVLATELGGSKQLLETIAGRPVTGLAYPYGEYDARVIAAAERAGYTSARSVEEGYNSRLDLEPFGVRGQNIEATTTLADFKEWVDTAMAHRYWLTVIYHEVVPDGAPVCTAPETADPCLGAYDIRHRDFVAQLDYLKSKGANVVPVNEAMAEADRELAPSAGTVSLSSQSPRTDAALTALPRDFGTETYRYRWYVNDRLVGDATTAAFSLAPAGHGDRGDRIRVEVTASDTRGRTSAAASATADVVNAPPTAGTVSLAPDGATGLTAVPQDFADADGDELAYEYTWFVNGAAAGTGGATLVPPQGGLVRVEARAADGHGGVSAAAVAERAIPALQPGPAKDTKPPAIRVSSPRAQRYRLGTRLRIRFSVTDPSGVASERATVRRRGGKAVPTRSGKRLRLTRTGIYVLRITAKDRVGNRATKTVTFRVTRGAAAARRSSAGARSAPPRVARLRSASN